MRSPNPNPNDTDLAPRAGPPTAGIARSRTPPLASLPLRDFASRLALCFSFFTLSSLASPPKSRRAPPDAPDSAPSSPSSLSSPPWTASPTPRLPYTSPHQRLAA